MTPSDTPSSRERILTAAYDYIAEHPSEEMPLRAVCDDAGVRLPTLYHNFDNKDDLLLEVQNLAFADFRDAALTLNFTGDFFADTRLAWQAHVQYGTGNPGHYLMMYGQFQPGATTRARDEAEAIMSGLCREAEKNGYLTVPPDLASEHIISNCVGTTLRFIVNGKTDHALSTQILDGTLAAISGSRNNRDLPPVTTAARELLLALSTGETSLEDPKVELLRHWLHTL